MDYLRLASMDGLFHELSLPENIEISETIKITNDNILDGNSKFWAELFNIKNIEILLNQLENNVYTSWGHIPQYLSIIEDKKLFLENVAEAKKMISDQSISPQKFFSYLEIFNILCKIYSDFKFYPFVLDLQTGFILNDYSSREIFDNCLNHSKNPYLQFIEDMIFPMVLESKPKVLFLEGKISFYNMAVAKLTKLYLPNTHISVTRHASEYYSLNKIGHYLQKNELLFQMIDSIILEYFTETENKLITYICDNKGSMNDVGNLIYKDKNKIITAPVLAPKSKNEMQFFYRSRNQREDLAISPFQIVDIRLEPYVKCHWNKCSFCGINKKYTFNDIEYHSDYFLAHLGQLRNVLKNGIKYIWFIDEAISANKLKILAEFFLKENLNIKWQARCRIDKQLLNKELVMQLAQSGLTELRMGLESASLNVLHDMNKFDDDFSLSLVEEIVKLYSEYEISIHFPMIIGFPTETITDRQQTYEFLSKLKEKYSFFTFNINIFQLDICSEVFKKWDRYAVFKVELPCAPNEFLGNWAEFRSKNDNKTLGYEQDQFMREKLYPWMPPKSIIKPHIFYRFSETIRNTLIWKNKKIQENKKGYYSSMQLKTIHNLTITYDKLNDTYIIYNWNNHHYIKGNCLLTDVLNEWNIPKSVTKGISELIEKNPGKYSEDDLVVLVKKLLYFEFLTDVTTENQKACKQLSLQSFYNQLYQTEEFPYRIQSDIMLRNWEEYITIGKVLDLGIGTGKNIDYLLSMGNQIEGVDFSKTAIEKLRKKYPMPNCKFILEDINNFHIKPLSYSLIICSLVFSHLSEIEIVQLSEKMIKGLVHKGCIYICDLSEKDPMHSLEKNPNSLRRKISRQYILDLFHELEIIDIVDSFQKEPKRVDYGGYFGLINFLGRKK